MELIILRHGKTAGNRENRYVGRTDEPLCSEFLAEAGIIAGDFSVSEVFVSPLIRAKQTAQILFPNAKQTIVEDFCEMNFGDFEGRTADEMENDESYGNWVEGGCEGECPNGESLNGFNSRVRVAFLRIVLDAVNNGREKLVIVAHGGTIMSVMSRFAEPPKTYFEWFVPNCHGWRAKVEKNGPDGDIVLSECSYL
ncbi:MAG: histidine phosphatase family protein [Oscillospiraceae bacterium]